MCGRVADQCDLRILWALTNADGFSDAISVLAASRIQCRIQCRIMTVSESFVNPMTLVPFHEGLLVAVDRKPLKPWVTLHATYALINDYKVQV